MLDAIKIFCLTFLVVQGVVSFAQSYPDNFRLVYHQNFELPQALLDFDMSDDSAWRIQAENEQNVLELHGESNYRSVVRSPFNIAVIRSFTLGDFVFEAKLAQTGREYGHRDLCLFFGMKDPTHFYYVHLATTADDHANNIFIVNDAPRIKIATTSSSGTDWGATGSWHTVRIERNLASGSIKVFFDQSKEPVMVANDSNFGVGHIGLGSFDDTGMFDDIKIWAPNIKNTHQSFFHD